MPARAKFATAILLVLSLVACASQGNGEDGKINDVIFPDGREHNFGKVKKGTILKHTFRIVNKSDKPLRFIGVRKGGCSPVNPYVTKGTLLLNEEGELKVAVHTTRFTGSKTIGLFVSTEQGKAHQTFKFLITCISEE